MDLVALFVIILLDQLQVAQLVCIIYSATPKPGRRVFVNIKKIFKKYQFLIVRFIKVVHPARYGEI